jgi:serine/threonine protein kinase
MRKGVTGRPKKATKSAPMRETPKKATSSVPADNTQIHRLPTFVHNLGYITYVDDSEVSVFEKLYNSMPVSTRFTDNQIKRAEKALKASEEWREWISDLSRKSSSGLASRKTCFNMLQKAQEVLQLQSTARSRQARSVFINVGTTVPGSGINSPDHADGVKLFKPDLASVATDVGKEHVRLCDMKTAWELKKVPTMEYAQAEILLSLLRCNQVLRDDPFRLFIYSIYLAGGILRLFQLNRGTVLCYESGLNIEQDTWLFLRFVIWLMLAEDDVQGLCGQPTAIGGRSIRFFSPGECKIPSPLVRVGFDLVTTRGTTVWPVELQDEQPTAEQETEDQQLHRLAALKLTWAHKARTNEADILRALNDVEELPKMFAWEEGPLTNEFDTLPDVKHSRRRLKLRPNGQLMKFSQEEQMNIFFPQVNETAVESSDEPHSRRLRWYLEEYCGVSVGTSPEGSLMHLYPEFRAVTEIERIRALRSAVHAIRKMFCRDQPILHRDISPANIMVTSPDLVNKEGAPPPGRLIDVDLTCMYGEPQSGALWRTGTYLYMAIDMLMEHHARHNPWHDIESVFWVLLFGELNRTDSGAKRRLDIATYSLGLSTEAARAEGLAGTKTLIVDQKWADWMGPQRPLLFGKTSFPVIRLMHRLRTELFEFKEQKEQYPLATLEDVATAAKVNAWIATTYTAPRFAVPKEEIEEIGGGVWEVEKGIEELSLEGKVKKTSPDESTHPAREDVERLKQAVITITERIDRWFAECIGDMEKI